MFLVLNFLNLAFFVGEEMEKSAISRKNVNNIIKCQQIEITILKKKVTLLMSQSFKVFLIAPTLNT
jgi:hypothetical protein